MSIIARGANVFTANASASPRIILPSASVFKTSTVLLLYILIISPGLYELPDGMFSTVQYYTNYICIKIEIRHSFHYSNYIASSTFVILHLLHFFRRLDRNSSSVKRNSLSNNYNWLVIFVEPEYSITISLGG